MTGKQNIGASILIAVISVLPLLRFSVEDVSLTRSTWSGLALVTLFLISFILLNHNRVHYKLLYFFSGSIALVTLSALISIHPAHKIAFFYYALSVLIAAAFYFLLPKKYFVYIALTLIACGSLYAQWGITQFALQHDLGLTKIGESQLTINTIGVASYYIHDQKIIRAYGPFAHANILGGVLVLTSMLLTAITPKQKLFMYGIAATLGLGLITTFSRTAMICAGIVALYALIKYKQKEFLIGIAILGALFSPLLISRSADSHDVAVHDRIEGATWAKHMATPELIVRGLGIGNYEPSLQYYLQKNFIKHYAWDIAPVHSAPIFLIMEIGIVLTIIIFVFIFYFIHVNKVWILLAILPALFFDHYFATQFGALAWLMSCAIILSRVY